MTSGTIVTIAFCVKNAELAIAKAVNSVVNQDYPHKQMEIIIVDGYSIDNTVPIIERMLSSSNIAYRVLFENKGLGNARQMAIQNATGVYIVWVDADLVLSKDYVRKQSEFMDAHPKVWMGRARYGFMSNSDILDFLENAPFVVVSSRYHDEAPLGISGTEGAIHRLEAVRQVGGFDVAMKGAGEDTDLAYRLKKAGWSAQVTGAFFCESCKTTWKGLWDQYLWWGYGAHYGYHKERSMVSLLRLSPLGGLVAGFLYLGEAYEISHRKSVILLPFHYMFKRIAWLFGFTKANREGYGHELANHRAGNNLQRQTIPN